MWPIAFFTGTTPSELEEFAILRKLLLKSTKGVTDFTVLYPLPFLSSFSSCWRQPSALPALGLSPWDYNISKQS